MAAVVNRCLVAAWAMGRFAQGHLLALAAFVFMTIVWLGMEKSHQGHHDHFDEPL